MSDQCDQAGQSKLFWLVVHVCRCTYVFVLFVHVCAHVLQVYVV